MLQMQDIQNGTDDGGDNAVPGRMVCTLIRHPIFAAGLSMSTPDQTGCLVST